MTTHLRPVFLLTGTLWMANASRSGGAPLIYSNDVVVTAFREERSSLRAPVQVFRVPLPGVSGETLARSLPEALTSLPSVMVQKTAYGQGSPYLRGFTGFRTLFLMDGVRLNNTVFREGPNQYWNTVDPYSLGSAEVVLGPASTLYGSDALGGVLLARSPEPLPWAGLPEIEGALATRLSSADDSIIGRAQAAGRPSAAWAWSGGLTLKHFGDLRGGRSVGRQSHTGYDEQDADARVYGFLSPQTRWMVAHQSVWQDDIWRTHRTIYGLRWRGLTPGDDRIHTYDQERHLTFLRLDQQTGGPSLGQWSGLVYHQAQIEDLYRVKADTSSDEQGFDVQSWGASLQLTTPGGPGRWIAGGSWDRDTVNSYARKYAPDGTLLKREIQGPVGDDALYDQAAIFTQYAHPFRDERAEVIAGVRATWAHADARQVKDPVSGQPMTIEDAWASLCGSLRSWVSLDETPSVVLWVGLSQGFRAPNLSDLTRFDIARSGELETPAPDLNPEKTLSAEGGAKVQGPHVRAELAAWYTWIEDLIVRTPTGRTVNNLREVTKKNAGRGFVYGAEGSLAWSVIEGWEARAVGSLMFGEVEGYPNAPNQKEWEYLSRLLPPTLELALRRTFHRGRIWVEGLSQMSARADHLSSGDRLDTQRIPPGGTPALAVFHLRGSAQVSDRFRLQAGLENLLDTDYRIHGSGVNEPGRHVTLAATWEF